MATAQMDTVIRHLRRTVFRHDEAGRTDGQLLASFIDQKDEASFEALVRRHGSMVFAVCRRVVGNHHDAEDAFQATFLVLARKAWSVRPRERVANWLHGVAIRTAMKAKSMTARRQGREKQVMEMPDPESAQHDSWLDLQPLLDQELNGLPENYRLPILLCDLEGKTIKDAAQQLGWPQGSLAGRLARGRKHLAKRLARRGVVLSAGPLALVFSQNVASAGVSMSLISSTVEAARIVAAGQTTVAGVVPCKVAVLMEEVLKTMFMTKLKNVMAVMLALATAIGIGAGSFGYRKASGQQTPAGQRSPDKNTEAVGGADKLSSSTQESPKPLDEEKLHGAWIAHDGNFSLIFGPGKTVRRIAETDLIRHDDTGTYSVDWSKDPHHLDLKLNVKMPAWQTIMELVEPGILCIEMGGRDEARPKDFTDETIVLTRMEKHPPGSKQAKQDADRETKVAEFYQRTGKYSTAYFYYQLVQIRYPGTDFAENAKQAIEDLKKHRTRLVDGSEVWGPPGQPLQPPPPPMIQEAPKQPPPPPMIQEAPKAKTPRLSQTAPAPNDENPTPRKVAERAARVGHIIIVGNTKTEDSEILKMIPLGPGDVLDYEALRTAKKKLAALKATIDLIESVDSSDCKDIRVTVVEK